VCLHWYGARSWSLARSSAGFQTRLFRLSRSSVSVESMRYAGRVDHLRQVTAVVRFISAEPLLGSLNGLDLSGVSWLIAGGESVGSKVRALVECSARGLQPKEQAVVWLRDLRDACRHVRVVFFFKQPIGLVEAEVREGNPWERTPASTERSVPRCCNGVLRKNQLRAVLFGRIRRIARRCGVGRTSVDPGRLKLGLCVRWT
jgi:hypothetical protein